jgi:hypothetical protein
MGSGFAEEEMFDRALRLAARGEECFRVSGATRTELHTFERSTA